MILRSRTILMTGMSFAAALSLASTAFLPATASGGKSNASARHHASYSWKQTPTGVHEQFRGLAAVSSRIAWVSGESGSVLRTRNRGATWKNVSPPGAEGLALRDIEAFGPDDAVTLSIGPGTDSRIFTTHDGGATWKETFRNKDPNAFYDCMAFSRDGSGLAVSDPVDGRWQFARTQNRGDTWRPFTPRSLPSASTDPVEFGFAASGTCIVSGPGHTYWLASGGVDIPRVWRSRDGGRTWKVFDTPLRGGLSAGIYSLAFRNGWRGIAVGGDYTVPNNGSRAAARTVTGGRTWRTSSSPVRGYRSGVAFVSHTVRTAVAVGPNGSDVSTDGGRTWTGFAKVGFDGVHCAKDGSCWASGTEGRVARLVRH